MFKLGFLTGGKLTRSSGAGVSSSQWTMGAAIGDGVVDFKTMVIGGVFSEETTLKVEGFKWKLGFLDQDSAVVQVVGFLVVILSSKLVSGTKASVVVSILSGDFVLVVSLRLTVI